MPDPINPIPPDAAQAMLAALREIAAFPHAAENRDLAFSAAVEIMAGIAARAAAAAIA